MACLLCKDGCHWCEPQNLPGWFTAGKENKTQTGHVLAGRHPRGTGFGSKVRTCRDCKHLRKILRNVRNHIKCADWRDTRGPATDIREKWPCCERFEKDEA